MSQPRTAVYAGSFDPVTNGHLELTRRATRLFDKVVLAVGVNPKKRTLLTTEQRLDILRQVTSDLPAVEVDSFEGLLVDYCSRIGAVAIVRGLRAVNDFEFEFQIGMANMDMAPGVITCFLLPQSGHEFISSSLVKEIAENGGDVSRYLPPAALNAVLEALGR